MADRITDERLRELAEGNFQTRFTGWEVQRISDELIAARAEVERLRADMREAMRLLWMHRHLMGVPISEWDSWDRRHDALLERHKETP